MSKQGTVSILFGLSVIVLLTNCAEKDTKNDLIPIAEVRETFDEETAKIKNREFDNLSFEDAYFSFPAVTEVFNLEYENEVTDITYSPDEAYDYLCRRIDELFPNMYNDEQKAYEIRFADAEPVNWKTPEDPYSMITAADLYFYPNMEQYKEENLATDRPLPMIANQNCYIELFNGVLRGYDQGRLAKRSGYDGRLDKFDALETFPIVYRTVDLNSEKIYHLESGDISIADAVRSADKYLSELELSFRELPFNPKVQSVNVLDIGNDCFAFCLKVVTEYKQMEFNSFEMDKLSYGVTYTRDQTNEIDLSGAAIMCEADQITRYRMLSPFAYSDITETASYDSVISLEKAAELASNYLTDGIDFNVLSVTAVYKSFSEKDVAQYAEEEDYRHRKITVRPCWRFVLQPTTTATDNLYYVFVDMVTAKAYACVQQMESGVEYD